MLRIYRRLADEALFFFAFSAFTGAYIDLPIRFASETTDMGASNPYNTMAMAGILFSLIVLGGSQWRQFAQIIRQAPFISLFVALAALSAIWSFDPAITLRRTLTLITTVGFGYYAVMRFPMDGIIRRIALVALVAGVASTAVALAIPRLGVMSVGGVTGNWNGVFTHKQQLGGVMFMGVLSLSWLLPRANFLRGTLYGLGIGFCLAVMYMTKSQTAVISLMLLPLVAAAVRIGRLSGVSRIWTTYLAAVVCIAIVSTLIVNIDEFMKILDRDVSLTGRVPLWGILLEKIADRPITGYGFGAFWLLDNPTAHHIQVLSGWKVPQAHNSYLDLLIQVGFPGLIVAIIILAGATLRAIRAVGDRVPWATFAASYLIINAITDLVETALFRPGDLQCVMVPLLYVALRMRNVAAAAPVQNALERPQTNNWSAAQAGVLHRG